MKKGFLIVTLLLVGAFLFIQNQTKGITVDNSVVRNKPAHSDNIVLDDRGDYIYTANIDVSTVTMMKADSKEVVTEIPVGDAPRQLTLSPDEHYLYVSSMDDHQVDVISVEKQEVIDTFDVGVEPYGVLTSQDGRTLYVANYRSNTISVIDVEKGQVEKEIQVPERPRTLALTPDGDKLYVPHYLSGKISVIDTENQKVIDEIQLADSPDQADQKKSQGIPNTLENFVISPDGKRAWVPHLLTNTDTPIHFEETIFPAISVIDLEKGEEMVDERKELFEEMNVTDKKDETMIVSNPYDVTFSPDGAKAYVVMSGSEDLVVFDRKRGGNATQVLRRIEGDNPRGIVMSPDGESVYVHNAMSHDLATIDTGGSSPYATATQSKEAIALIGNDPLDPLVREGKRVFYSANSDEYAAEITGNNWMSCASCHSDGLINGLTLQTQKGPRNVPSNAVATKTGLFMWDGSRDDFKDYLLTVQGEMGGMTEYDASKPLPEDVSHMYDALFAYLKESPDFEPPKSPYRAEDGSLTEEAMQGKELFEGKGNCMSCHAGSEFTDSDQAVGENKDLTTDNTDFLHDIGTTNEGDQPSDGDARADFTNPRETNQFDTPTLRGVWATAPYLHDGSAETLEEAVEKHEYQEVSLLSQQEVEQITAYLKSIE
ncbi:MULTISPECIES: beta-propeller fold lactonase family protein [Pontibacillus]|uniref:Beta-propeller fold lactonase family protein n=1 Tax=Pontibacillus chungwhensis TaxID=265426 RepID=A0ABY8V0Y3_9BACI|nr:MULTISPECIES: beta-propeller fold lactonase family protein [Pontibacillus]MCD5325532.1 beta-propeller fold lactonase family protein [Pontibacillus sp. HN14]WIF98641.1 beta-propeller fold lactonase family protein [Pontibacillus chungwhensis]